MNCASLTVGRAHRREGEEAVAPLAEPRDPLVHVKKPREPFGHVRLHAKQLPREMPVVGGKESVR